MTNHYDEKKVLRELEKKGVKVDFAQHTIVVNTEKNNVGISSLGKLDYLVHYCGWCCRFVKNANERVADDAAETNYNKNKKAAKAEAKKKELLKEKQNSSKGIIRKATSLSSKAMYKTIKNGKK